MTAPGGVRAEGKPLLVGPRDGTEVRLVLGLSLGDGLGLGVAVGGVHVSGTVWQSCPVLRA